MRYTNKRSFFISDIFEWFLSKKYRHKPKSLHQSFERFRRDIRIKNWMRSQPEIINNLENRHYDPKVYIKSKWEPPPAHQDIEEQINNFELEVEKEVEKQARRTKKSRTNLTKSQIRIRNNLVRNDNFIVLPSDK